MFALELDQRREDRFGPELSLVTRVDPGERRAHEPRRDLGTEPPRGELGHALGRPAAARDEGLAQRAKLAAPAQQRRAREAERAQGHLHERAITDHEALTTFRRCAHELAVDSALAQEGIEDRLAQEGVRSALDAVAVHRDGAHDTARGIARVHEQHLATAPLALEGRRESGDPRADHDDIDLGRLRHGASERSHGLRERPHSRDRRVGQAAVTEIRDVAARGLRRLCHLSHPARDPIRRGREQAGIEIALERDLRAVGGRDLAELGTPVERDHVGTGFRHHSSHMDAIVDVEDQRALVRSTRLAMAW